MPGRPPVKMTEYEGVPVITVAIPQTPWSAVSSNIAMYRWLGWPLVRSVLRTSDLIHSVDAQCCGILASAWARRARLPHVAQVVGSDVNSMLPRIHRSPRVNGWERHVHAVACNSEALARAFLALYPQARNVRTVYRGVDLEGFHPAGPARGPLANRPPVRFLFIGGFIPYSALPHRANTKGGETLLAAWQAVEDDLADAGASLLVAGPYADDPRIARWRAVLRHPERVDLAGPLPPGSVSAYLRSADVVLVPSMEEGLPNIAIEASACGRAVFGSDVGGIPEVVEQGQTGLILPAGASEAWGEALVTYAGRPDVLEQMGIQARRRMEARFDRRGYAPEMLKLYHTAIINNSSKHG